MNNTHKKAIAVFITFVAFITASGLFLFFKGVREASEETSSDNLNIAIILNRAVLAEGENLDVSVKNNDAVDATLTNIEIQKYFPEKDKWKTANKDIRCPCYAECSDVRHIISPGKSETFLWQQDTNDWKSDIITKGITLPECDKVKDGIYRAKMKYYAGEDTLLSKVRILYSDSFSVK